MKFPRIPVALLLLTGLAWPAETPSATTPAAAVAKTAPKPAKVAKAKKPTRAETRKAAALQASMDSLRRIDSLRRVDSLHTFDSLFRIQDSLRVDSLQRADSLRRIDSIARVARTWYVTKVRDFTGSPELVQVLRGDLRHKLLRNGGLRIAEPTAFDTCTSFECSWREGLASNSGKLVYSALYRTPDSGWKLSSWLFEMASGSKLDSASLVVGKTEIDHTLRLAHEMARRLHPTPSQALCIADSLAQARTLWAFEVPVNHTTDTNMNARLRGLFRDAFVATGRGRSLFLKDSVYCPTRSCLDTMAAALGAHRALQFDIAQRPDSSWRLGLVVSHTASDSLIDSLLVTSPTFEGLLAKAVPLLLPAPTDCRPPCERRDTRSAKLVWSVGTVRTDSGKASAGAALARQLEQQFAPDARHQYVRADSLAKTDASWIQRRIDVRLTGSDSLWNFQATVRDPRTGSATDSLTLSRGGYQPRVFAWFARKLLASIHPVPAGCGSPCLEDSARLANSTWFFAPTDARPEDAGLARLVDKKLLEKMAGKKRAKILALPDSIPCRTAICLDSAAVALGADHIVHPVLAMTADSIWSVVARVAEKPSFDVATDSNIQFRSGPLDEAFDSIAERLVDALVRIPPRCDLCVSMDTLEAGLALIEPSWTDVSDTLQNLFVDSLRGVLGREGHYQVLPLAATSPLYASSGSSCDAACRQELLCKTGATSMVTSSLTRTGSGWKVSAQLVDLRTGKTLSSMSSLEHRNDAQRLREIAPWVARKLSGADTADVAPSSRRKLDLPWGKLVALLIPVAVGFSSVISRW